MQGAFPIDYARIFLYYECIKYQALYSDLKEQTTNSFNAYICQVG